MLPDDPCQACRQAPVEAVVDHDDPQQPYRVCHACERRLGGLCLRPLEWFNLAALHGPGKFLLHDDFYDDGEAMQPEEDVEEPDKYPAPTLDQVRADRERLIDYAMTRFTLKEGVADAFTPHDKKGVLESLRVRVLASRNPDITARAYDLCARVVGPVAEDWVRGQWAEYPPEYLYSLADATAHCLPFEEGFARVTTVLEGTAAATRGQGCYALAHFRSPQALDWMEAHPEIMQAEGWGRVAALSHFTWARAKTWLGLGRPLSLRALDALLACHHYDTIQLKQHQPQLEDPAPAEEMARELDDYAARDAVPHVRKEVAAIKGYWGLPG